MKVLKFGGTSVANSENISRVIDILSSRIKDEKLVVVVSALGGVTDMLIRVGELANNKDQKFLELFEEIRKRHKEVWTELIGDGHKEEFRYLEEQLESLKQILKGVFLINEFSPKTRDKVLSFGELLSSYILSQALSQKLKDVVLKDSRELIVTDSNFTQADLQIDKTKKRVSSFFKENKARLTILPGFISRSEDGETTTLGRGGSDFTAAIIAAVVGASTLEIWTDVSGMFTAHPKLVRQAFPIAELSYQEAMELSHFGAKVLYPPTIQPALQKQVPIRIKNTFEPEAEGTFITHRVNNDHGIIKGISHLDGIALITLEGNGMIGIPGFSKRMFEALANNKVNVILITQASSEHSICVGILQKDASLAQKAINNEFAYEMSLNKINPTRVETDLAVIAVIGDNMKGHQGVSGKMFSALGTNNVNIRAIAQGASELNISAVIDSRDVKKALNTLHYKFFEKQVKTLNIFIKGVGNVGGILLEQIKNQQDYLKNQVLLDLRVTGISNSRKMVFAERGIDLENWKDLLENGEDQTFKGWFETVRDLNLRDSVFLDVTASAEVAETYGDYLRQSISVVACNKIACSSDYQTYRNLKEWSREYNAPFLFETNVGAGLPVINTLSNLINSGDEIHSIKAVLSGSLNFIFNNFNSKASFHDVVKQAQKEGYTEPDPRIDLSGVDVMRKILILVRESGFELDLEDIENESFLPKQSLETKSVEEFYQSLIDHKEHFEKIYEDAAADGAKLKYVAEFTDGKASVGLEQVPKDHPFYNLEGKDNIVLFYTSRYVEQPLIIKGAGAGSEVTASGLFGDIISLGNR